MSDPVQFFVHGTPKPQGSKRAYVNKHTGKAHLVESSKGVGTWRGDVRAAAVAVMGENPPSQRPLTVSVMFYMRRPKSHPKTKRTWPTARPDVDKLARAVLDAVTGIVFQDDSQVVSLHAFKLWDQEQPSGREGALISIAEVPE